jgi:hypothetical protein
LEDDEQAMRLFRGICLATSLSLCALTTAASVHAQPAGASVPGKEHAKRLFEEGVELEKKGDYAGALAKYKEAEQITVTPGLRFHSGYCLEMTGKLVAALDTYEAADKLARDQNKQDVRAAITARLEPLRARVPQLALRLTTTGVGAEVQLDGATVGAPLLDGKAFRMEAGEHVITARAPGFKPFSRKVQVPESATTQVEVSLERAAGAVAPVAGAAVPPAAAQPASTPPQDGQPAGSVGEPPAETSAHRSRALPIATTAGAVVLAGTGIALFLAAGSAHSTAESDCLAHATCDNQQSKIRTFDALALGGFVGAAGLGVISVILWTSKAPDRAAAPSGAWVVATPSTVGVAGAF